MARYHINPETGSPTKCSAEIRVCPFGSENGHFNDIWLARISYEMSVDKLLSGETVKFNFMSEEEIESFTNGDCGFFAKELQAQIGGELVCVGYKTEKDKSIIGREWEHIALKLSDGRIADAEGIWKVEDFSSHYTEKMYLEVDIFSIKSSDFKDLGITGRVFDINPQYSAKKVANFISINS